MKWKKEFVEHLSDELQITQIKIRESLETWKGSPFEDETPKHPIELVNEKYPEGWCVEGCKEVVNDLNGFYGKNLVPSGGFFGSLLCDNNLKWNYSTVFFGTNITKTEYLQLTGREPKQRDWTGVKFRLNFNEYTLFKEGELYTFGSKIAYFTSNEVSNIFKSGTWVELKDEPDTIHVQLPNVPHYGGNDNPFPPIRIIQHYNLSFELGNVIKYVLRNKGSKIEDLKKAIDYLNFEIGKNKK